MWVPQITQVMDGHRLIHGDLGAPHELRTLQTIMKPVVSCDIPMKSL